jgi:hypothetical protein
VSKVEGPTCRRVTLDPQIQLHRRKDEVSCHEDALQPGQNTEEIEQPFDI